MLSKVLTATHLDIYFSCWVQLFGHYQWYGLDSALWKMPNSWIRYAVFVPEDHLTSFWYFYFDVKNQVKQSKREWQSILPQKSRCKIEKEFLSIFEKDWDFPRCCKQQKHNANVLKYNLNVDIMLDSFDSKYVGPFWNWHFKYYSTKYFILKQLMKYHSWFQGTWKLNIHWCHFFEGLYRE